MKTQLVSPQLSVAAYVSGILVIENDAVENGFTLPLFANGSPTLIFQTSQARCQNQSIGNLLLYGQTIQPGELLIKEPFTLIAYFFYPHVLKTLFGINANELTNACIDMNFLKQAKQFVLKEQLLNTPSLAVRLQLIDRFILTLPEVTSSNSSKIIFATNKIVRSKGLDALSNIQKDLFISERTFQRLFETQVGISPKMYCRVSQFNAAFQQLNQRRFSKLGDLAYNNGFADQSHFIRVFKEFTRLTPKEYLALSAPYVS